MAATANMSSCSEHTIAQGPFGVGTDQRDSNGSPVTHLGPSGVTRRGVGSGRNYSRKAVTGNVQGREGSRWAQGARKRAQQPLPLWRVAITTTDSWQCPRQAVTLVWHKEGTRAGDQPRCLDPAYGRGTMSSPRTFILSV